MRHSTDCAPLLLQSFTYDERALTLAALEREVDRCGGWLLEQRTVSPAAVQIHLEVQTREIMDLYAALLVAGLQLTRGTHLTLTSGCTASLYASRLACGGNGPERTGIAPVLLEITFLQDALDLPGSLHQLALRSASA